MTTETPLLPRTYPAQILKIAESAEYLSRQLGRDISEHVVNRLIKGGVLVVRRNGVHRYVTRRSCDQYVAHMTDAPVDLDAGERVGSPLYPPAIPK